MKRPKQLSLSLKNKPKRGRPRIDRSKIKQFGGSLLKGNARTARPLSTQSPIHLTMRASKACGKYSFLKKNVAGKILATVNSVAKTHKIKIYRYKNVGNHLHLVIQLTERKQYQSFIRSLTCKIKFGIEKTFQTKFEKLWDYRPHTRILNWGKDFIGIKDYMLKNEMDACGITRTAENLKILKFNLMANRIALLREAQRWKIETAKINFATQGQIILF